MQAPDSKAVYRRAAAGVKVCEPRGESFSIWVPPRPGDRRGRIIGCHGAHAATELGAAYQSVYHLAGGLRRKEALFFTTATAHGWPEEVQREHGRTVLGRMDKAAGGNAMHVSIWEEGGESGNELHMHSFLAMPDVDLVPATWSGEMVPAKLEAISHHETVKRFDTAGSAGFYIGRVHDAFGAAGYFDTPDKAELRRGVRLGTMGGSRVVQSKALRRDLAQDAGILAPVVYAKHPPKPKPVVYKADLFDGNLPVHVRPADTVSGPRRRPKPEALPQLAFEAGPTVVDMMRDLAQTHREMAAIVGVSRPHATNVLRGRFRPSRAMSSAILAAHRQLGGDHLRLAA